MVMGAVMRWTLGRRLVLIIVAGLAPVLAVVAYNEYSVRQTRHQEIHELAGASAQQAAIEIQRLVTGAENVLKAVAAAPAVKALDTARCASYLNELKTQIPELSVIVVLDLNGVSQCRSDQAATGLNSSDRSYFRDALAAPGKLVIGEYTISRATGRAGLPLALAASDEAGTPRMVIVAGLDLSWLGGTLKSRSLAKNGSLTIADRQGVIIAREPFPERFVGTRIPEQFMTLVRGSEAGTLEVTSQDGTQRVIGYLPSTLPPEGIYISVGISVDEAFRELNKGTGRAIVIATLASAASVCVALLFSRKLVQGPVDRIHRVLATRRKGEARARTGMSADEGELEALGAEFDDFMDDLEQANALKEAAEERRQLASQELAHRLKNIIATIQSVALQTLRNGAEPGALESFTRRLGAIAQAHNLLLTETAAGAQLEDAIRASLTSFVDPDSPRLSMSGPQVQLKPRTVQCLSMAFHELATNAAKYGALASKEGTISIEWRIVDDAFILKWLERGGPTVEVPSHRGFGTKMIERVLAMELNAEVSLRYERPGLDCTIQAPSEAIHIAPNS
jgi:two-component sensor histidine kinase